MDIVRRVGIPLVGLRKSQISSPLTHSVAKQNIEAVSPAKRNETPKVNIKSLLELVKTRRDQIETDDFCQIMSFLNDEDDYVNRLKKLEEARSTLEAYHAPDSDLKCFFGLLDYIINQHEFFIPTELEKCMKLEDILELFVTQANSSFRIYIADQWTKSKREVQGREVVLRRLNSEDVKDLNLPEKRIIEYLNFHEHLKNTCERIRDSELFLESYQCMRKLFLQMQYAKDLASVKSLPHSANGYVHLVDTFQVKFETTRLLPFRVYCCANSLYFVNEETMSFEFGISHREMSLNSMANDELLFEITTITTNHQRNKIFIMKSETSAVKIAWLKLLMDILYTHAEEERQKIISSKSPLSLV